MSELELLETTHASEAAHWYTREGAEAHRIIGKNGKERNTTLADARKLELLPSVTTIIKCAASEGLERWKQRQVLEAALTTPMLDDHGDWKPEEEWIAQIMRDAGEQARKAAERGTEIHAAIESYYQGEEYRYLFEPVPTVVNAVEDTFGPQDWLAEETFVSAWGFGGKMDLCCEISALGAVHYHGILLDFKTKDVVNNDTKGYDEHLMQLAAYRQGLTEKGFRPEQCANVFVSRREPWTVKIHTWKEEELDRGWRMYRALLDFWKAKTGYESGFAHTDFSF